MVEDLFEKYASKMDRMFAKGVYSFNIEEQLNSLSKDSIYSVARNIGMSKISTLNKDKLIERVLTEYKPLIERQFNFFEEERYEILKSYVNNGGMKIFDQINESELGKTAYFMQQGLIFPSLKDEKAVFLMPKVVQKLVMQMDTPQYKDRIRLNGEILNLYRGMNKAYGVIESKCIQELINKYCMHLDGFEIENIIREGQYFYKEYREEKSFFVNNNIENWLDLVDDIKKNNNDLDYATIKKDELISCIDEKWLYTTKFGKTFFKEFTDTFEINKDMTIQIMNDLSFDIQDNEPNEAIKGLLDLINSDNNNLKNYIEVITNKFINNIRLWRYKGATINEINGKNNTVKSEKTVGRNDPCICGSGKKYKKCCGKI
ncbi:SEC-C domain-containing protein [Clostridium sp. YB-6]|uniref:SEC-C domain-containing protein n=2 Tax=Clostridium weizhouense TaxID=2859781 RepID=A0ABS7AP81_9CLOT|nr:SEC-C domain-containing protein [Clostridium weizhouense]